MLVLWSGSCSWASCLRASGKLPEASVRKPGDSQHLLHCGHSPGLRVPTPRHCPGQALKDSEARRKPQPWVCSRNTSQITEQKENNLGHGRGRLDYPAPHSPPASSRNASSRVLLTEYKKLLVPRLVRAEDPTAQLTAHLLPKNRVTHPHQGSRGAHGSRASFRLIPKGL